MKKSLLASLAVLSALFAHSQTTLTIPDLTNENAFVQQYDTSLAKQASVCGESACRKFYGEWATIKAPTVITNRPDWVYEASPASSVVASTKPCGSYKVVRVERRICSVSLEVQIRTVVIEYYYKRNDFNSLLGRAMME